MITYIPFLKAKRGERSAVGVLVSKVKQAICPFFDFPRKNEEYDEDRYIGTTQDIVTGLKKHWGTAAEFYFDDRDIKQKIKVGGQEKYAYVLGALQGLNFIPVVGLNRSDHNASVARLKRNGKIASDVVVLRVEPRNFEDFDVVKDQVEYELGDVFQQFDEIDLVCDCRVCSGMNVSETAQQIAAFIQKFSATYKKVRRVIVTGSSIPGSLGEIVKPKNTRIVPRRELEIIAKTRDLVDGDVIAGDYGIVSPFFSDKEFEPELFPKITAPKLIYSFNHSHYVSRGASLATGGQRQYLGMTKTLCEQEFFREDYSAGDAYFLEKSKGIGKNATNNTVVAPSVVAHITYMVMGAKL